jgi:hypothetical protein
MTNISFYIETMEEEEAFLHYIFEEKCKDEMSEEEWKEWEEERTEEEWKEWEADFLCKEEDWDSNW